MLPDEVSHDDGTEMIVQAVQHSPAKLILHSPNGDPLGLEALPWDIIEIITSFLKQSDFVRISKTSREFYQMVQPIIWRHPRISYHGPLTLFTNFLNRPPIITVPRLKDWDRVCWVRHRQVKQMVLRLDAGSGLNELASNLLHRVVRHCPQVRIKLFFNGKLDQRYLLKDPLVFFPGVNLIIISATGLSPDPNEITIGPRGLKEVQVPKSGSNFEADLNLVVEEMRREIKEDKKQVTLAASLHPYLQITATDWRGMNDYVAYEVGRDIRGSAAHVQLA